MRFFLSLIIIVFSNPAFSNFESSVEKLIEKYKISKRLLSVSVLNSDGKVIYKLNEDKFKIPASLTKIVVAGAMLENFTPNHKFSTTIYIDKTPSQNALFGNIYLKGGGDPSFTSERMWYLVNEFKRQDINIIEGDIVLDDYIFDDLWIDPNRSTRRVSRAYDSPTFGFSFNWNSLNVFIKPTSLEKKSDVTLDPENVFFKLVNKTKTSSFPTKIETNLSDRTVTVSGQINAKSDERVFYVPVQDSLWGVHHLKYFLERRNIRVLGKIRRGKVPKNAKPVASSDGADMSEIVKMMMKFSNNFITEMMTKHLALKKGSKKGNIKKGLQIIKSHLESHVDSKDFKIQSVSGLSRKNNFKALSLAKLLHEYKNLKYSTEFVASLPIGGLDGTLKKRKIPNTIRAKTGQLNGVYAIAGYADYPNKVFVIMYNGARNVRPFIDELVSLL